jgi:hypothetical protein
MLKLFTKSRLTKLINHSLKCNSTSRPENAETTHFGFKTVNMSEKQGLVNNVFDSVANKYDL